MSLAIKFAGIGSFITLFVGWLALRFSHDFFPAQILWMVFLLPLIVIAQVWPDLHVLTGRSEHTLQFFLFMCVYFILIGAAFGVLLAMFQRRTR